MAKFTFEWGPGVRAKIKPGDAAKEFERIRKKRGRLSPATILAEARSKTAKLHREFEWNDRAAAETYRKDQARRLLNGLREIEVVRGKSQEPRRVYVRQESGDNGGIYVPIKVVPQGDPTLAVLQDAIEDLEGWVGRYADLREQLGNGFDSVQKAVKTLICRLNRVKNRKAG
ncbi:MAG: hypothetical protein GWO24_11420 [Akkermansiaceae bacterium]|nr:hypothetical protein [Akkermansiaceae bacterium]